MARNDVPVSVLLEALPERRVLGAPPAAVPGEEGVTPATESP